VDASKAEAEAAKKKANDAKNAASAKTAANKNQPKNQQSAKK